MERSTSKAFNAQVFTGILSERIKYLEAELARCKEEIIELNRKIEELVNFQNRAIGASMAASAILTALLKYFFNV